MEIVDLCGDSDDDGRPEEIRHHAHHGTVDSLRREDRARKAYGRISKVHHSQVADMAGSNRTNFTARSPVKTKDSSNLDEKCSNNCLTDAIDGTTVEVNEDFAVPKIDAVYSYVDDPNLVHSSGIYGENLSISLKGVPDLSNRPTIRHTIESPESPSTKYPESPESMASIEKTEYPTTLEYPDALESPESPQSRKSPEPPGSTVPLQLVECAETPSLESPQSPSLVSPESPPLESPQSPYLESPESPESLGHPESSESPESPEPLEPSAIQCSAMASSGSANVEDVLETCMKQDDFEINPKNRINSKPIEYFGCGKTADVNSIRFFKCNDVEIEQTDDDPLAGVTSKLDQDVEEVLCSDEDLDFVPTFNCLYCNFTTSVEHSYHTHLKAHLPGSKPYTRLYCPECDYTTGLRKYLTFHRFKKHRVTPYERKIADKLKNRKKQQKKDVVKKEIKTEMRDSRT